MIDSPVNWGAFFECSRRIPQVKRKTQRLAIETLCEDNALGCAIGEEFSYNRNGTHALGGFMGRTAVDRDNAGSL